MTAQSSPFSGAAVTALGLAAARSVESGRPDRLIDDPLARELYRAAGAPLPMRLDWPVPGETVSRAEALHLHGSRYIGLRTRYYDDFLLAAAGEGIRQAVLLGAGLDTRAHRLALPADLRLFELDRPELLTWKRGAIAALGRVPQCCSLHVGTDLRDGWSDPLRQAGFDAGAPSVFVAEGLLAYLDREQQLALLERVTALAVLGSRLALDRIVGDPHDGRLATLTRRSGIDMSALIAGGEGADAALLLFERGWQVDEQPVAALAARYGRDLSDPFADADAGAGAGDPPWLDTAFLQARA